ncbi:PAS domain S-box protein [Geodermatophilus sp. SYSU D00758]
MSTTRVRVLVADDDRSIRDALADILDSLPGTVVLGVADDHADAVRRAAELHPDVVLVDMRMPAGTGPDTVREIRARAPGTAVLALSAFEDHEHVLEMLAAGAAGYLLKGTPGEEIVEAVERASRGQLSMAVDLSARCVGALLRDRTECRRAIADLRRSEETFHDLVDFVPAAVVLVGPDDRIRLVNAGTHRIFGRSTRELIGQPASTLLPRRHHTAFADWVANARSAPGDEPLVPPAELAGVRGDGTEFPVTVTMKFMRLGGEQLVAVFLRALGAADAAGPHAPHLPESASDALVIVDGAGRVTLVNGQAERLFGYGSDELLGQPLELLLGGPVETYVRRWGTPHPSPQEQVAEPGGELTGRRKDGTVFPADVAFSPVRDERGPSIAATIRDRTEQRRHELALEHSFHLLRKSDREHQLLLTHLVRAQEDERKRIAAGIHDDPLQAITAASLRLQQLRRRLHAPADRELLATVEETVQQAIGRLRHLTFDLQPPPAERGLVANLTGYLEQLRSDTGTAYTVDNRLRFEPSADVQLIVYRIAQEALTNIRRHARAGTVAVRLSTVDDGCLVAIADDGVGYQPVVESTPGHLGVPLMVERAEIAGGWCRIESAPGRGTTVEFWIPHTADVLHGVRQAAEMPAP